MANITNVVIACFDEEIKKITRKGFSSVFGENQIKVCSNIAELNCWIQDKTDIALIFDKYFLGYMISYELIRLRFQNKHFLSYFADKGDDAHYFGMRVHEIGADGFIPKIEDVESFKKCIYQVQSGVKVYPESITRSFENDDWLLDKAYINEVTIPEMLIGESIQALDVLKKKSVTTFILVLLLYLNIQDSSEEKSDTQSQATGICFSKVF